nr:MAG TPA: hypothetical protein [Microviridae sp.]
MLQGCIYGTIRSPTLVVRKDSYESRNDCFCCECCCESLRCILLFPY